MLLVAFSVLLLLVGLLIGLLRPKSELWVWVDSIYYPLAIAGVVILYFESAPFRSVISAEHLQSSLKKQLEAIESEKPIIVAGLSGKEIVRNAGNNLTSISKLARVCKSVASIDQKCSAANDYSPIIERGERALLTYEDERDIGDVCEVANSIFIEISESRQISKFLSLLIARHYFEGLDKGFMTFDLERVQDYIDSLKPQLEAEAAQMVRILKLNESDREIMEPLYEAQINYGTLVLRAFEVCLRAPESVRSGQYSEWASRQGEVLSSFDKGEQELQRLRISANEMNPAAIFRTSYWPFLIVLALSLKFAKGIAALRSKYQTA